MLSVIFFLLLFFFRLLKISALVVVWNLLYDYLGQSDVGELLWKQITGTALCILEMFVYPPHPLSTWWVIKTDWSEGEIKELWAVFGASFQQTPLCFSYGLTHCQITTYQNKKLPNKSEPVDLRPKCYPSCHHPLTSPFLFIPSARPLPSTLSLNPSLHLSSLPLFPNIPPTTPLKRLSCPFVFSQSSHPARPWRHRPAFPPTAAAPPGSSLSLQPTWCLLPSSRRAPLPPLFDPRTPLLPRAPARMLTACKVNC